MITRQFEEEFSRVFGISNAFSFWKGRVALYAILRGLGIGRGDEVILPGYTCVMNVNPIVYVGAKPVYVDIDPKTYNIDPAAVEKHITAKTKAIIAQHTYGIPCDMAKISQIAQKHSIVVLEDCCLALGSRFQGRLCGTFGKAAYFSFQWNKPFTTGLGGMAITNDTALAEKIQTLCNTELVEPTLKDKIMLAIQLAVYRAFIFPRTTALAQSVFRFLTKKGLVIGSSSTAEFEPKMPDGFFKGMSALQANSGLKQMRKLQANMAHRKQITALYNQLLSEIGYPPLEFDDAMDPVLVRYPIRVQDKQKALSDAASAGIELGSWFECPLHPIETPLEAYGYELGMCPNAEKASAEVVNLPVHPRVSPATARRTIEFIKKYLVCSA